MFCYRRNLKLGYFPRNLSILELSVVMWICFSVLYGLVQHIFKIFQLYHWITRFSKLSDTWIYNRICSRTTCKAQCIAWSKNLSIHEPRGVMWTHFQYTHFKVFSNDSNCIVLQDHMHSSRALYILLGLKYIRNDNLCITHKSLHPFRGSNTTKIANFNRNVMNIYLVLNHNICNPDEVM